MKKVALALILTSFFAGNIFAQTRSVSFEHGTFSEGLAKAKTSSKLIFMDAYTTWCGPCKYMSNTVFTQDKVADFFNANFINLKFDMEKGEGIELAKKYGIKAYPTFLILDSAGNLVHKIVGGSDADDFLAKAKVSLDPKTSLAGQQAAYQAGNREPAFVNAYLNTLKDAYMEDVAQDVAVAYLRSLKESDRTSKESWTIYDSFINDASSKEFMFILTNRIKFTDAVGDSAVSAKIANVFTEKAMSYLVNRKGSVYSKEEVQKFRGIIAASRPDNILKYNTILDMADAKFLKNGVALAGIVEVSLKKLELTDQDCYSILSQVTPVVAEYATKKEMTQLSSYIDSRISALKEVKAKPYFEKLKLKLTEKIDEPKK